MKLAGRKSRILVKHASAIALALMIGAEAQAQVRRVTADVDAVVISEQVRPGTEVRVGLTVRLPEGLHVQSDRPRDRR